MSRFLLTLFLCLISVGARASQGFDTFGTGTPDLLTTGYATAQSTTAISVAAWYYQNSSGDNAEGTIIQNLSNGISGFDVSLNVSTTSMRMLVGGSGGNDVFTWPVPSTKVWRHLCISYPPTSSASTPTVYINGATVVVTPTSTHTPAGNTNKILIGNFSAVETWDGALADVAYWNGALLTAADCRALAQGASPLTVQKVNLSLYLPLYGQSTTHEPDYGALRVTSTVAGPKFFPDPPLARFNSQP